MLTEDGPDTLITAIAARPGAEDKAYIVGSGWLLRVSLDTEIVRSCFDELRWMNEGLVVSIHGAETPPAMDHSGGAGAWYGRRHDAGQPWKATACRYARPKPFINPPRCDDVKMRFRTRSAEVRSGRRRLERRLLPTLVPRGSPATPPISTATCIFALPMLWSFLSDRCTSYTLTSSWHEPPVSVCPSRAPSSSRSSRTCYTQRSRCSVRHGSSTGPARGPRRLSSVFRAASNQEHTGTRSHGCKRPNSNISTNA